MSRNVTIVVIILILVVLAGYLVWIRSRLTPTTQPIGEREVPTISPTVTLSPTASPSATPSATPRVSPRVATSGAAVR